MKPQDEADWVPITVRFGGRRVLRLLKTVMVWLGADEALVPDADAELAAEGCDAVPPVCAVAAEALKPRTAPKTAPATAKRLNWNIDSP
jgi:hypothetical protein